jgi:DNA-binding transcriptional LysR family regulator
MLDLIRLFTLSVEAGSFSEAGRRLGLNPSSVSRRISELEAALSSRLLNRTTRKLSLTEAGQIYYSRVRSIVEQIDEAAIAVSQIQSSPRGTVRVTTPLVFGRVALAPILVEFAEAYPEIQLDVMATDRIIDLVEHNLDVAIRMMPPEDSLLIGKRVMATPRILCASPAYVGRFGSPKSPDDLQLHRLLAYRRSAGYANWSIRHAGGGQRHEVSISAVLTADTNEILYEATLRGLGISIQPFWLVSADLAAGRLVRVLDKFEATASSFDSSLYVLYLQRAGLPPKVRLFVDFVQAGLEQRFALDGERRRQSVPG